MNHRLAAAVLSVTFALGAPMTALAVSPLAASLPERIGLYVEIQSLDTERLAFAETELARRLRAYPPLVEWLRREGPKLEALGREIRAVLDASPRDIARGILNGSIVLAVAPPDDPASDHAAAVLLIEAVDEALLQTVFDRLVDEQRRSGAWQASQEMAFGDAAAVVHVVRTDDRQPLVYQTIVGSLALVANDERLLGEVLARRARHAAANLTEKASFRAAFDRLDSTAALSAYVDAQAWTALLGKHAPHASQPRSLRQNIVGTWKALDYFAASVDMAPQVEVEFLAGWNPEALPAAVAEMLAAIAGETQMHDRIPHEAVVAIAGRWRPGVFAKLWLGSATHDRQGGGDPVQLNAWRQEDLGWIAAWTLASGLGPELSIYAAPALELTGAKPRLIPVDVVVDVETMPLESSDAEHPLSLTLAPMLHTALSVFAAAYNARTGSETAQVVTERQGELEQAALIGIEERLAAAEASYAVAGSRLWIGSTRDAVHRAATLARDQSLAAKLSDRGSLTAAIDRPSHFFYADLAALREIFWSYRKVLTALAIRREPDDEAVRGNLRELFAVLRLSDTIVGVAKIEDSRLALGLRIESVPQDR